MPKIFVYNYDFEYASKSVFFCYAKVLRDRLFITIHIDSVKEQDIDYIGNEDKKTPQTFLSPWEKSFWRVFKTV